MTKTEEVIKNTLRICANSGVESCNDCPYRDSGEAACMDSVEADALEYIEWLEQENAKLKAKADKIVYCKDCKYAHLTNNGKCKYCDYWDSEYETSTQLYLNRDAYCSNGERKEI